MGDQVIYLEKYIDSTTSLPSELQRILNSIKDLDERSDDLAAQIQENVEAALKVAPASGASTRKASSSGGSEAEELAALRAQIENDQRLLIQFAEEKVQLAVQGYDLLEQHLAQADYDIAQLEHELTAMGMGDLGGVSLGGPEYSGGTTYDDPAPKRAASRLRDAPSFDSFEAPGVGGAVLPDPKPKKTTITLNLSRQLSGFEAAAATGEAQTPGIDSLGGGTLQKRPPSTAARKAPTPLPQAAAPPSEGGYQRNRRAAAAGVHAVAAEVAAMEEDDLSPEHQPRGAGAGGPHGGGGYGGGGAPPMHMQRGAQASTHGRTAAEVAQMFQEREPLIPGLNHAAERPQAPGRLLTHQDVNAGLIGRYAELYWPEDNLWYLMKIQDFDSVTRKASIMYTTGEAEELSLEEVIKDGHMSIINTHLRQ